MILGVKPKEVVSVPSEGLPIEASRVWRMWGGWTGRQERNRVDNFKMVIPISRVTLWHRRQYDRSRLRQTSPVGRSSGRYRRCPSTSEFFQSGSSDIDSFCRNGGLDGSSLKRRSLILLLLALSSPFRLPENLSRRDSELDFVLLIGLSSLVGSSSDVTSGAAFDFGLLLYRGLGGDSIFGYVFGSVIGFGGGLRMTRCIGPKSKSSPRGKYSMIRRKAFVLFFPYLINSRLQSKPLRKFVGVVIAVPGRLVEAIFVAPEICR